MGIKPNLHAIDRVVRAVIGIGCVYAGFIEQTLISNNLVSILVGAFGVINLLAAMLSYCPIYGIAGLSSCKQEPDDI